MGASEWIAIAAMVVMLLLSAGGLAMQLGSLKASLNTLIEKVDKMDKALDARPCIAHGERLVKIEGTLTDHGRRIDHLERG